MQQTYIKGFTSCGHWESKQTRVEICGHLLPRAKINTLKFEYFTSYLSNLIVSVNNYDLIFSFAANYYLEGFSLWYVLEISSEEIR